MFKILCLGCVLSLSLNAEMTEGFLNSPVPSSLRNKQEAKFNHKNFPINMNKPKFISMVATTEADIPINLEQPEIKPIIIATGESSPYTLTKQQFLYVILTNIFVTCLIVADVVGVKLFEIPLPFPIFGHKSVEHTCGMLVFPITFLLGDIINEYYGAKATKQTVYIGLAMSLLVFGIINIAQFLPYLDKPFNVSKDSFDMIFGSAKLMYIASICAYLIGQLSDIWLFGVIKRITKGKLLWLRATGSTVISQFLDSFIVSYIAYSLGKSLTGQIPATLPEIFNIAITGYGLKFAISLAMTPILYFLRYIMHDKFKLEAIPAEEGDVAQKDGGLF